ncbi:MAG: hypothetical protein ABIN91_11710 [Mucilaginibacter sp.]|uniref:hypothetical protein n=1 Tax=Mucilaginibacter sp. TaxID=1882438 RepID=UPI003266594A
MKKLAFCLLVAIFASTISFAQSKDSSAVKKDTIAVKSKLADGSSFDRAIVIMETSERTGTPAEYVWLHKNYPGAKVKSQSLNYHNKKPYDILHIANAEGVALDIYFDISNFFGKF